MVFRSESRRGAAVTYPLVTVVIPALNEEVWIASCLKALESQSYPADRIEIVVVDNGSHDRTCEIVESRGIRVLHEQKRSAYAARNQAIRNSESDWLAFTDADCLADKDWLKELWQRAEETQADLVSGLTIYNAVKDNLGNYLLAESHSPAVLKDAVEQHHCVAGGNMFVRRKLFAQLGMFKEIRSGSDIEFSRRVFASGKNIAMAQKAMVRHQCDLTNIEFLKRTFRERHGQTIHTGLHGTGAFFRNLKNIPWRPGLRAIRPAVEVNKSTSRVLVVWLYGWANRWSGFLGSQWAITQRTLWRL